MRIGVWTTQEMRLARDPLRPLDRFNFLHTAVLQSPGLSPKYDMSCQPGLSKMHISQHYDAFTTQLSRDTWHTKSVTDNVDYHSRKFTLTYACARSSLMTESDRCYFSFDKAKARS
jgi:hypothetical protein